MKARFKISFYSKFERDHSFFAIIFGPKPFYEAYAASQAEVDQILEEVSNDSNDIYVRIVEDKSWKPAGPYR